MQEYGAEGEADVDRLMEQLADDAGVDMRMPKGCEREPLAQLAARKARNLAPKPSSTSASTCLGIEDVAQGVSMQEYGAEGEADVDRLMEQLADDAGVGDEVFEVDTP
jgi:uncharacterized protein with von Willebrand factor type A (vWA) domain